MARPLTLLLLASLAVAGCLSPEDSVLEESGPTWPISYRESAFDTAVLVFSLHDADDTSFTLRVGAVWDGYPEWNASAWPVTPTSFADEPRSETLGFAIIRERSGIYETLPEGVRLYFCGIPTPENLSASVQLGPVNEAKEFYVGARRAASGGCDLVREVETPSLLGPIASDEVIHIVTWVSNHTGRLMTGEHQVQLSEARPGRLDVTRLSALPSREELRDGIALAIEDVGAFGSGMDFVHRGHSDVPFAVAMKTFMSANVGAGEWYYKLPGQGTIRFEGTSAPAASGIACIEGCYEGVDPWLVAGGPGEWEVGVRINACYAETEFYCRPEVHIIPFSS